MADNGNRGPNDFRSRNVRKRREPPIIDAAATEVPLDPSEPVLDEGADAAPPPLADAHPTPLQVTATESPDGEESPVSHDSADPVIFGSATRESSVKPETADAGPVADDVAPVATTAEAEPASVDPVVRPTGEPAPASIGGAVPPYAVPAARSGGGIAPWLLTLSTLALLGALAWVLYTEPQRSGAPEIAELRTKVATLEARPDPSQIQGSVAALDKRVATADADRADLAKSVSGLTARLDAVSQQAQAAEADAAKADAEKLAPVQPAPAPSGMAAVATVGALTALAAKIDGVDARVATLSTAQGQTAKSVADLPKPVTPDFGPIDAKVAALDGHVNALDGKVNGSDARLNAFDAKVNGVDGKINGFDARMNAFENRDNGIEAKVNGNDVKAKAIEAEANATEAKADAIEAKANGIDAKANDTAAALGRLQASVATLPRIDLAPLQAATTMLDGKIGKIEGQLAAPKDGARMTEARAVGSADESRAAPIALVGQAVGRAVAEGLPYASDLDALRALGAEPDAVAKLSPLAAKGAPTAAALLDRWNAGQADVLAAVKPAESGSAFDRLAANARALVQVRRVGAVQGDDPAAIVSQVGAALSSSDVPAALAAWDRLPEAGKDKSQDWAAAARGRVEAAAAAQSLVGRAIATLGKTKS